MSTGTAINALFVGFSAADEDTLTLPVSTVGSTVIFDNLTSPPGATASRTVASAGTILDFTLNNLSTGNSFVAGTAYTNTDSAHFSPVYHLAYFNFTDAADYDSVLGSVPITPTEDSYILAHGGYSDWTFVGAEDLTVAGEEDWNNLVYAFQNVRTSVPEPASLALLGSALIGLGAFRRRRDRS